MIRIFLAILVVLTLVASMTILESCVKIPSVCDQNIDTSFICQTANTHELHAESLAELIVDLNEIALKSRIYVPGDAMRYIAILRHIVLSGHSYDYLIDAIYKVNDILSPYERLGVMIIAKHIDLFRSDQIISDVDRDLLLQLLQSLSDRVAKYQPVK